MPLAFTNIYMFLLFSLGFFAYEIKIVFWNFFSSILTLLTACSSCQIYYLLLAHAYSCNVCLYIYKCSSRWRCDCGNFWKLWQRSSAKLLVIGCVLVVVGVVLLIVLFLHFLFVVVFIFFCFYESELETGRSENMPKIFLWAKNCDKLKEKCRKLLLILLFHQGNGDGGVYEYLK